MERLLADGAPHTFGEVYQLLARLISPDDAIARHDKERPKNLKASRVAKVTYGTLRIVSQILARLRARGGMTSTGRGSKAVYQLMDPETRTRVLQRRSEVASAKYVASKQAKEQAQP